MATKTKQKKSQTKRLVPKDVALARQKKKYNENFEDVDELWNLCIEFFETHEPKEWNSARLFTYLNISKSKWMYWSDKKKEYMEVREYVNQHLEMKYLDSLEKPACTGAIFALKNLGYSDKQDIQATMKGNISVEQMLKGTKIKA